MLLKRVAAIIRAQQISHTWPLRRAAASSLLYPNQTRRPSAAVRGRPAVVFPTLWLQLQRIRLSQAQSHPPPPLHQSLHPLPLRRYCFHITPTTWPNAMMLPCFYSNILYFVAANLLIRWVCNSWFLVGVWDNDLRNLGTWRQWVRAVVEFCECRGCCRVA